MAQHHAEDFFFRSKTFILNVALYILFIVSLIDYLLYKLNPYVTKIFAVFVKLNS